MSSIATPSGDATTPTSAKAVIAATIGNMLEWYDILIYAAFAAPISKAFFPTDNPTLSLLVGWIVFAIGFTARPLGAVLLGAYADRRGRRAALSLTIFLMALGTAMIAFCPAHASIGVAAPVVIVLARIIQGFSAGGEIGGAVSTLVENAPAERRGFYASFQQMSQGGANILSGLVPLLIAFSLSEADVTSWGWRVAFAVGLLIAPVGVYIRRSLDEAALFKQAQSQPEARTPIKVVLVDHWRGVLAGVLIVMLWTVAQYTTSFMPTFASRELKMSLTNSYFAPFVTGLVLLLSPVIGILSDRFRRKWVMALGALAALALAYPTFANLVAQPTLPTLILTQVVVGLCLLIYSAPASAVLAELFPTHVRATGVSLAYSLGVAIFGGFAPTIITALIGSTGRPVSIAFYLMGAALVSLLAVLLLRDRTGERLI